MESSPQAVAFEQAMSGEEDDQKKCGPGIGARKLSVDERRMKQRPGARAREKRVCLSRSRSSTVGEHRP